MFFCVIKRSTILIILTCLFVTAIILDIGKTQLVDRIMIRNEVQTLVLDAGHGGFDGGAVGISGTTEQDINLSIAQRTEILANFFGIPTQMTRSNSEALDYNPEKTIRQNKIADIRAREGIIEAASNPVLISIHLNKFQNSQYSGAQVFYSHNHSDSQILANSLQRNLCIGLNPNNKRKEKIASDAIYLMKNLTCPAVIVECGFLSNPQEEKLLGQDAYHKQVAVCILNGYLIYQEQKEIKT